MQLLSKPISDILLGDTDITDITGTGNIWHAKIPQQTTSGSTEPQSISIYFYTYAVTPNDTKSGRSDLDTHMVRVHICGTDDHQMNQVARYVRLALDRIEPGFYSDLYIQGSRFLNAYYEPEGNYQLELQEWRLEFQFRVIDEDIREGLTMANLMYRQKITKTYSDFAIAAFTNDIEIFELPVKGVVHGIIANTTTPFVCGDQYSISVGITGDSIFYKSPSDATVVGDPDPTDLLVVASYTDVTSIRAFVTSIQNLSTATAGQIDFYIYYSILN